MPNSIAVTCFQHRPAVLVMLLALLCWTSPASAVPSFARQTGMACAACHTVFPELTPFGREFKLNGYVLDNIKQIKGTNLENRETLSLNSLPPLSLMLQISYTRTGKPLPDSAVAGALAKDGDVLFPQQASFFYAGKIADGLGAFVQLTYDGAEDHFGIDNTDVRYVRHYAFGGANDNDHSLIFGVTVNNNPTVQDVWNTTQAWSFPYSGSSTAPAPIASAVLDSGAGTIGQDVAGAGLYAWFDDMLYAEISLYTAAIVGGAHPLDSTQHHVVHNASPYWRVAYEYRWDRDSIEVGAYGMLVREYPGDGKPLQGASDQYNDAALDAQYQFIGEDHLFTVLTTYIHERQRLYASVADGFAQNTGNTLKTFKLAGEYTYRRTIGGSLGFFNITGTTDPLLYAQSPVVGSLASNPDSRGYIGEINYLPWLNTKLQLQYTVYSKFNGLANDYDGAGRSAADNNTFYALVWVNF